MKKSSRSGVLLCRGLLFFGSEKGKSPKKEKNLRKQGLDISPTWHKRSSENFHLANRTGPCHQVDLRREKREGRKKDGK